MPDFYFSAPTAQTLIDAISPPDPAPKFRFQTVDLNVIAPIQGQDATPETTDENGNVIPAQPARGSSARYYCCIRLDGATIVPPTGVTLETAEVGSAVCGIFA